MISLVTFDLEMTDRPVFDISDICYLLEYDLELFYFKMYMSLDFLTNCVTINFLKIDLLNKVDHLSSNLHQKFED